MKRRSDVFKREMFDYAKKKAFWQAVILYMVHVAVILVFGAVIGLIIGLSTGRTNDQVLGRQIGMVVMMIFAVGIPLFISFKKKLQSMRAVFLIMLSALLTYLEGVIVGFLPALYLSLIDGRNDA